MCEHLASSIMTDELNVAAAESAIYEYAGRTFLEVARFDRHGDFGRSAVCTIGSINAALLGSSAPWPVIARELQRAGWLGEDDAARVALIWWFGRLIGNTDMHEGNLAFRPGSSLAPVYDMLPMIYAPARGGELPGPAYQPALPLPAEAAVWRIAAQAAVRFWHTCSADECISPAFRQTCENNVRILADIVPRF